MSKAMIYFQRHRCSTLRADKRDEMETRFRAWEFRSKIAHHSLVIVEFEPSQTSFGSTFRSLFHCYRSREFSLPSSWLVSTVKLVCDRSKTEPDAFKRTRKLFIRSRASKPVSKFRTKWVERSERKLRWKFRNLRLQSLNRKLVGLGALGQV